MQTRGTSVIPPKDHFRRHCHCARHGRFDSRCGAASAAPCTYSACNGLDPETTGSANDAVAKLDLLSMYGGYLAELGWSPSCQAFCTRLRYDPSTSGGTGEYA
ncbi:hypothetical protein ACQPYH_02830 [Kribbella sp. CA-245084]|uniref:hypothetical protein n=1 Tax=Kribbella sp. CA-245084 TaxID=3239940 RepID=UPI003D8C9A34